MRRPRIPNKVRLSFLIAATLGVAAIVTCGYFRRLIIAIKFIDIEANDTKIDNEKLAAGRWYIAKSTVYIAIIRGEVGMGVECLPDWGDEASTAAFPRIYYKSYRSLPNRDPWVEWTDWANWLFVGLGPYHQDRHPMGGLTAEPYDDRGLRIPNWLMAGAIVVPWVNRWRRWRMSRRFRAGLCPDCGYDLRGCIPSGMLVQCPECGNATVASAAV